MSLKQAQETRQREVQNPAEDISCRISLFSSCFLLKLNLHKVKLCKIQVCSYTNLYDLFKSVFVVLSIIDTTTYSTIV